MQYGRDIDQNVKNRTFQSLCESHCTAPCEFRESMTSEELSDWLLEQGIPDKYCKVFESMKLWFLFMHPCICLVRLPFSIDNYVDGKEFISLTYEEVKGMVPPLGLAKKVLRLIPKVSMCVVC